MKKIMSYGQKGYSKIIVCGDLHLTSSTPMNRCDNYGETLFEKFSYIIQTADAFSKNEFGAVIFPGDFFDSTPSFPLFNKVLSKIKEFNKIKCFVVFGQHDTVYRQRQGSALDCLIRTGTVTLLNDQPYNISSVHGNCIHLYGTSYGDTLPKPMTSNNILAIHKMVVNETVPFESDDMIYASELLKNNPDFQFIVSGDNHKSFERSDDNRILLNCGSVGRSTSAQLEHIPHFFVIDTEDFFSFERIDIPVQPFHEVFKMDAIELEKQREQLISSSQSEFIDLMNSAQRTKNTFNTLVDAALDKLKKDDPARFDRVFKHLNEILLEAKNC
jgi:DNA repair exonuclease SbcCD nuclease subunit